MKRASSAVIVVSLISLLLASLALNWLLFKQSELLYREVSEVRLNPLGVKSFSAAPRAPGATQKLVLFYGDSHAQDWPAPTKLAHHTFINRGIGAQTTAQVLARFDAHVTPLRPDIIVVNVGINNLKTIPLWPERQTAIIAECVANIQQIVNHAKQNGATVILTTLFPLGPVSLVRQPFWSPAVAQSVNGVNAQLRAWHSPNIVILDAYTILAQGDAMHPDYVQDTLHINAAGYAALNAELTKILEGLK